MRIGLDASLAASRGSGSGSYAAHLVRHLVALDTENEYRLYFRRRDAGENPLFPLQAPHLRGRVTDAPLALWRLHLNLAARLLQDRVDLYHSLGFFLPWLWRGRAVVTIHDLHPVLFPQHWWWPGTRTSYLALRVHIPVSVRRASRILAPSEYTKQTICRRFGVSPEKIVVTPYGVDPFFFAPPAEGELRAVEQRFGPEGFFLFVGVLSPLKNLTGLVEAFARLRGRLKRPCLPLLVVGKPAGRYWERALLPVIRRLNLSEAIVLTGYLDDAMLRALYRRAVALILPSFAEGFGLPVLEAMACGTPVVASRASALPEVAGDAALYVDPHDPEELSLAMERLATDDALCQELSSRGPSRASSFTWERTARQTLDAYRRA